MKPYPIPSKEVSDAMDAKVNVHIFGAVIELMEGGLLSGGGTADTAAQRIITICKKEQTRQLLRMGAAVAKLNNQEKP